MRKTLQHKDALISYYVYGKGVSLLLIHGFAETHSIWSRQVKYLSAYCTVIVPDLPGSGRSELYNTAEKNISIDDLAACIYSIIKKENIAQCIMLGHSMGGYITLAFAEKYQEKLKAIGLVNSTAFADSEEKKQNRIKGIKMMETYGSFAFLKTSIPGLFAEQFKDEHADAITNLIEEGKKFQKENLQQYYYAMMQRPDKTQVLKSSKLPVLFVMGTEDKAAPLSDVLKQAHLPEISYIHIVENVGHMSMWEAPGKLNRIVRNLVNAFE